MKKKKRDAVFNWIESEIYSWPYTSKEIEFLERWITEGYYMESIPDEMKHLIGTRVSVQAKYRHLTEMTEAIKTVFKHLSKDQQTLFQLIYGQDPSSNEEYESFREKIVSQIAEHLGWRRQKSTMLN